jgi:HK97 family phage prohead protease
LEVQGRLDVHDNAVAKQVHRLMKEGRLSGWSFGYTLPEGVQARRNGTNEVSEVDLVEVGPTLKGSNREAQHKP